MKTYDDEQLKAIHAQGGYYLVLAPPGCGKTDILSERILKARESGVNFEDMLCLTFTNRASRGMKERVRQKIGEDANSIFVGNVHRYCSQFIYNNSIIPENSAIVDENDMADILIQYDDTLFTRTNKRTNRVTVNKDLVNLVDNIDGFLSQMIFGHPEHSIYLPKSEYQRYYDIACAANFDARKVPDIKVVDYKIVKYTLMYRDYKRERNIMSFSDILIYAYNGLLHDTENEFKKYSWIQVDEVQDLNALQTAIIDELLDKSGDFTVMYLGDEQQAIFSFLGAKLGQLELLKRKCKGNILSLGNNYRSPDYLLEVFNTYAQAELGVDPELLPKPISHELKGKYDLSLTGNDDTEKEDNRVKAMIDYYLKFDDERVAILVPTNDAADRISDRLAKENISHFKISGTDMFKTKSYKTLSSLFCVNANEFNFLAWARLLYGIGATRSGADAREYINDMKRIMMIPSDLLEEESYIARFNREYLSREFVFFDTETTGLNVLEDDIVQIAAFKVSEGHRVPGTDFNIFIHTDREIPKKLGDKENPLIEAYANNELLGREQGLRLFLDYIGDCPILGHNVNYDYRILQSNVERYLHEQVTFDIFDSLRLIKCVEPNLRMYKLEFLLKELHLDGKNSHLADEDIAATKALVDYCVKKSQHIISAQQTWYARQKTQNIINKMRPLIPIIENLQAHLFQPVNAIYRTIADDLKSVYDDLLSMGMIDDLGNKFNIFLQYVQSEWVDMDVQESVFDQISKHITDITSSINEGDLVNSQNLINERIFIMTVYKGKGLEFENVVLLGAIDDVYPFYMVNKILRDYNATEEEKARARQDKMEDARKFYVALSRAKKRLCISYTHRNDWGYAARLTPFMNSIKHYFTKF